MVTNQDDMKGKESWMEIKCKRRQEPNLGRSFQGNPKKNFAGTMEKDKNLKEQGTPKEEPITKGTCMDATKETKGVRFSRWNKPPSNMDKTPMEDLNEKKETMSNSTHFGRVFSRKIATLRF